MNWTSLKFIIGFLVILFIGLMVLGGFSIISNEDATDNIDPKMNVAEE